MDETETVTVTAESGSTVNMRAEAKSTAALAERVPIGARVEILGRRGEWSKVKYGARTGYMMTKFLTAEKEPEPEEELTLEERVALLEARVTILEARADAGQDQRGENIISHSKFFSLKNQT